MKTAWKEGMRRTCRRRTLPLPVWRQLYADLRKYTAQLLVVNNELARLMELARKAEATG